MVNPLDLECVISERRAEIEREIRQEALIRQLRSDERLAHELNPRRGHRSGAIVLPLSVRTSLGGVFLPLLIALVLTLGWASIIATRLVLELTQ